MLKITLGEMLKRFRIEKKIEARQVCEGLCSTAMMSNFESGKKVPDVLLFEYMLERMGVSPALFSIMVSQEEYEYYRWKEQVCEAIENRDCVKLETLLASKVTKKEYCNSKLERQFLLYATAIDCGINEKYREAVVMLDEAAKLTILDIKQIGDSKVLLSSREVHLIILYLDYGIKSKQLSLDNGLLLFNTIESYVYNGKMDLCEKSKCYSKLICSGLCIFQDCLSESRQIELCEKTIRLLRESVNFYDITGLLEIYIPLLLKNGCQEVEFYVKQYEVFKDILEMANIDVVYRVEQFVNTTPKYYMFHEYLSSQRIKKALTQEKLSEGICEPETYSRVESGRRKPSRKNFKALAEKLDINWCYYRGELDTSELEVFELRSLQRIESIKGRYQKSLNILGEMEKYLDMTSIINIQYIKSYEYITKWKLGVLTLEETYNKLMELFDMTSKDKVNASGLVYYSQTEIEIIGKIAQILRRLNRVQEGIDFIEKIVNQMKNSQVSMKSQWNGFAFLLHVLSGLYFENKEYKVAIEILGYIINESIRRRDGAGLSETLDSVADCLEHIGEQYSMEYKKLYRYTYYVADFFGIEKVTGFAKKYYEDNFEPNMLWY